MQPRSTPAINIVSFAPICTLTDNSLQLTFPVTQLYSMSQYQNLLPVRHVTGDSNSAPFCYQIMLSCLIRYGRILSVSPLTDVSIRVSSHWYQLFCSPVTDSHSPLCPLYRYIFPFSLPHNESDLWSFWLLCQ